MLKKLWKALSRAYLKEWFLHLFTTEESQLIEALVKIGVPREWAPIAVGKIRDEILKRIAKL